jgi:hypothetical protein
MKTFNKFLFVIAFFIISYTTNGQITVDDLIQPITSQLTQSDISEINNANIIFEEANKMMDELKEEEARLDKVLKKGGRKAEKKSVYAKMYWVDATKRYKEGFSIIQQTLINRLNASPIDYPDDKSTIQSLIDKSKQQFDNAATNLANYDNVSKKKYKKEIKYYDLTSEMQSINQTFIDGITNLIDAFGVLAAQEIKKQKALNDEKAWAAALNINTIQAYNDYINNNPDGKYINDAKIKIAELEEKAKLEEERKRKEEEERLARERQMQEEMMKQQQQQKTNEVKKPSVEGLVYKVQIMATYYQASPEQIKKLYDGPYEVVELFEDEYYKYLIGEFTSFSEACAYQKSLPIKSFVVSYLDGKRISNREAKKIEKNNR